MKTEKLHLGCSLMLVSGVGQKCAKTSESRRLTSAFPGEQRLSGHLSSFASKNMEYCNTAKAVPDKDLHLHLARQLLLQMLTMTHHTYVHQNFCYYICRFWSPFVGNPGAKYLCVACHFHLT